MRQLSSPRLYYAAGYRAPAPALLRARMSVSFIFFVNGFVVASWLLPAPVVAPNLPMLMLALLICLLLQRSYTISF